MIWKKLVSESSYLNKEDAAEIIRDTAKRFLDSVSVERTLIDDSYQKGKEKGKEEGIAEGMEKGMSQRSLEIARKMLAKGMDEASIMDMTGLTAEEVKLLKAEM